MFGLTNIINDFNEMKLPQTILTIGRIHNEICPLLNTETDRIECQEKIKKKILKLCKEYLNE